MISLDGTVAVVTGAGSGIGRGIARHAAAEGMHVVVTDIAKAADTAAEITAAGGSATAADLDVSDAAAWRAVTEATLAAHERIDLLVNNAGFALPADTAIDLTDEGWHRLIAVNQSGVFYGMRAVLPAMVAAGRGSIVNVASICAQIGLLGVFGYSATKGAVTAMTRQAAVEYAATGVRINAVCPGVIDTPAIPMTEERRARIETSCPQGRFGQPADIAAMVVHLGRAESAFVTGQVIAVDGGWTAR